MQDFVSTQWIRVTGLVASIALAWAAFSPFGFPWRGAAWVTLAALGALWLRMRSVRAVAAPVPVVVHVTKAVP